MKFMFFVFIFLISPLVLANETVIERLNGTVSVSSPATASAPAILGQKLQSGAVVTTGDQASVVLRFADGQVVALHGNTSLKITQYRYDPKISSNDSSTLELVKGAARFLSGLLAKRNPDAFRLATPTATIGIRGTDFMASYQNPTFVSVLQGNVVLNSSAGSLSLVAGQIGSVASMGATPLATSFTALPFGVQGAFSALAGEALAAVAGGVAAGTEVGATSAAVGGISTTAIAAGAAVAAAAAIAASGGENSGGTTTATTTATSTQ